MAENREYAFLRIELKAMGHSMADVALVTQAADGLVCASVWAALQTTENGLTDDFSRARELVKMSADYPKANQRFYPGFGSFGSPPFDVEPYDALDFGVLVGVNAWLKKIVQNHDVELFNRIFSFAEVSRLEHHSPLLLEVAVLLGGATFAVPLLTYGLMRAVVRCRQLELNNELRETDVELKREELKQRRIQTEVLSSVRDTIRGPGQSVTVSDATLAAITTISSPSVAELATSPLIGSISVGVTTRLDGK